MLCGIHHKAERSRRKWSGDGDVGGHHRREQRSTSWEHRNQPGHLTGQIGRDGPLDQRLQRKRSNVPRLEETDLKQYMHTDNIAHGTNHDSLGLKAVQLLPVVLTIATCVSDTLRWPPFFVSK